MPAFARGSRVYEVVWNLPQQLLGTMDQERHSPEFTPETEDAILFLEDINEPPYRIDRMLTYLKHVGKFKGVRAVVFGLMPDCHPSPQETYTLEDVIRDVLADLPCPILYDFPSGHGGTNVTLPFGVRAAVEGATLSILEAPVS